MGAESGAGVAVDTYGGPAIDPTENVLALVDAETKFQNALREAEAKYQNGMRDAESNKRDALDAQKVMYEGRISEILTVQVKTTSELISTQLDKVTTSLAAQITTLTKATSDQITALSATLSERLSQLERFRWEVGGKTSVSDPAIADVLRELTTNVRSLKSSERESAGKSAGVGMMAVIAGQSILIIAAVITVAVLLLRQH